MDTGPVYHTVCLFTSAGTKLYCLVTEAMRVNNLPKVAVDSAAAGIEPAVSNRKSDALTTGHCATQGFCESPNLYILFIEFCSQSLDCYHIYGDNKQL